MNLEALFRIISDESITENLERLTKLFPGKVVFTTSFGIEDQAISHMIFENNLDIEVVTIDTGRLFPETYKVFNETIKRYHKEIKVLFPENLMVERMVTEKGPFSFYYSKENRLECCSTRKVRPLNRALKGMKCWITGIRSDQSENRNNMQIVEYDKEREMFKYHPLFVWTRDDVMNFIGKNKVPYNILHDSGFISIGCQPCTRPVVEGESFRSGRWWWEEGGRKECGLHVGSGHSAQSTG